MLSKLPPTVDPLKHTLGQVLLSTCKIKATNLKNNMKSGITRSWFAESTEVHGQVGRIFIKRDTLVNINHEVAAYHVARLSGLVDVAPCTVRMIYGLKKGWSEAADKPHNKKCVVQMYLRNYEQGGYETKNSKSFYKRCRLFDYLIDNGDRHEGNVMSLDNHYVAIDNAFGFSGRNCASTPRFDYHWGKKFHVEIERLRGSNILDLLVPLLNKTALKDFVSRLTAITTETQ